MSRKMNLCFICLVTSQAHSVWFCCSTPQLFSFHQIMTTPTEPVVNFDTFLSHIQTLKIPFLDLVNHLQCTFNIEDVIGNGGAMLAYKALLRYNSQQDPIEVALKVPKQIFEETSRDKVINEMLTAILQEIRIMKSLEENPYVATLYGITTFRDLKPILVMELAISSLNDYLISKKDTGDRVAWRTKARFCYEVSEGIKSLHSVNIVHGDIKADNVLLFGNPADEDELVSKLSDFGYSSTIASIARGGGTGESPKHLAPECTPRADDEMRIYANKPTKDNYSYGLFVWQVAADGKVPYKHMDVEEIDEAKHSDKELSQLMELLPKDTPECFKRLIVGMTRYTPNEREDLMNVRAIISEIDDVDLHKDIKYFEAKKAYENSAPDTRAPEVLIASYSLRRIFFLSYEAAASTGDAHAACHMSQCYESGYGTEQDEAKMISWAIRAAEGGNFESVKSIASSHSHSLTQLPDNRILLFPWILVTAEAGHRDSQLFISQCYKNGIGVEKNDIKVEKWLEKYKKNGAPTEYKLQETWTLIGAVMKGNIEAIKFFMLEDKADVNAVVSDFAPLQLAAYYGHNNVIKMLVAEYGADLSIKYEAGWTLLHFATVKGHFDTVKLLVIEFGADVNAKDNTGSTPLHSAAQNGHIDIVKLLVDELEADINAKDNKGRTPLICSSGEKSKEIAIALLEHPRMNIYEKTENGQTLLHLAVKYRQEIVVQILVEQFHFDIHTKDSNGQIPLELADDLVHLSCTCDGCKKNPIIGERYKCTVCEDFDFCSACYSTVDHFNGEHIFKIVELPSVKYLLTPC